MMSYNGCGTAEVSPPRPDARTVNRPVGDLRASSPRQCVSRPGEPSGTRISGLGRRASVEDGTPAGRGDQLAVAGQHAAGVLRRRMGDPGVAPGPQHVVID